MQFLDVLVRSTDDFDVCVVEDSPVVDSILSRIVHSIRINQIKDCEEE